MNSLFIFLVLMTPLFASSPKYMISGGQSKTKLQKKSKNLDRYKFHLDKKKAVVSEAKVKEIDINGQKFKIEVQDAFDSDGKIPFFKVDFPRGVFSHDLYALLATRGTSGDRYHYFFRKPSGLFVYSGLHPEITFDDERNRFVSYERDGAQIYETKWVVKDYHFITSND